MVSLCELAVGNFYYDYEYSMFISFSDKSGTFIGGSHISTVWKHLQRKFNLSIIQKCKTNSIESGHVVGSLLLI